MPLENIEADDTDRDFANCSGVAFSANAGYTMLTKTNIEVEKGPVDSHHTEGVYLTVALRLKGIGCRGKFTIEVCVTSSRSTVQLRT